MSTLFTGLLFLVLAVLAVTAPGTAAVDPRDTDSPMGALEFLHWDHPWNANHYSGDRPERVVALMKEAGVGIVRMDFLWDDVQPARDKWDFAKYDRLVDLLVRNDIKILGLLNYNASWAGENWNTAPDAGLYTAYARQVVARYKDRVKYWEIWNEPDQSIYWVPQDELVSYVKLLKKVYPELKTEDPTCVVLLGGLSGGAVDPLKKIYALGGKDYFDIVNIHPFVSPVSEQPLERLKQMHADVMAVMKQAGDGDKPIWVTEIGCPGIDVPYKVKNWWLGENPDLNEQAAWVETVYRELPRMEGVEKVFWAFFRDTPNHFTDGIDFFGITNEDFSRKPAFSAYKKAAEAYAPSGQR